MVELTGRTTNTQYNASIPFVDDGHNKMSAQNDATQHYALSTLGDGYTYRVMILDTGCSTTLMHNSINNFIGNAKPSNIRVRGFSGNALEKGDLHGDLHAYVVTSNTNNDGTKLSFLRLR